jgi:5-methylcytosine-specific restriction protein A
MRVSWTRDEAILGLDVLFSHTPAVLTMESEPIIDLSETLNRLPIIPIDKREDYFRNPAGVRRQLLTFQWSLTKEEKASHVGEIFYIVFSEYGDNPEELHRIAQAIRRCAGYRQFGQYGDANETEGFPEGAILSHIHRNIEARYTEKWTEILMECEVCSLRPQGIYAGMGEKTILGKHLLTAPTDFDPAIKLTASDFITVCPNCHRALHLTRPWRGRRDFEGILIV